MEIPLHIRKIAEEMIRSSPNAVDVDVMKPVSERDDTLCQLRTLQVLRNSVLLVLLRFAF